MKVERKIQKAKMKTPARLVWLDERGALVGWTLLDNLFENVRKELLGTLPVWENKS